MMGKGKEEVKLSIIVLTWNSEEFVEKCLDSIKLSVKEPLYEVIIIDNFSTDSTLRLIDRTLPGVKVIKNTCNRGVAPARNQGLPAAKGRYIVFLDIDTYVFPEAIDKIIRYMNWKRDIGICAPRFVSVDGSVQDSARRFPTVLTKLLRRIDVKWAQEWLKQESYNLEMVKNPVEVDYAIGACHVIREKALDEVGLLDDKIFYGPEDVDLCLRMWLKGWKVVYYPNSQVIHYEQRITRKKLFSRITFEHIRGLAYFFEIQVLFQ